MSPSVAPVNPAARRERVGDGSHEAGPYSPSSPDPVRQALSRLVVLFGSRVLAKKGRCGNSRSSLQKGAGR